MTEIMPDFQAYRKQDKMPPYNDLGQEHPIKLPTRIREEPYSVRPKRVITGVAFDKIVN